MAQQSMILNMLKTPQQVREEQLAKLREQSTAQAKLLASPVSATTALPGLISRYAAGAMAEQATDIEKARRRGLETAAGLLSVGAGNLGPAQALRSAMFSPEERQAQDVQNIMRGLNTNDPAALKQAAQQLSDLGLVGAATQLTQRAEQIVDKLQAQGYRIAKEARDERTSEQTERLTELKIQKAEKELSGKEPPKIGAINPQDFTPSSIAKFADSGDYNDLDEKVRVKDQVDNRTPQEKNLDRYLSLIEDGKEDAALKFGRAANLVPEMSTTLQKDYLNSSQQRQQAASNILKYTSLADDIKNAGDTFGGGADATWTEFYKEITGSTDAISELRTRYRNVRASNAMQNLPPGAASDKDVEIALQGVPPENANAATVESFLRGLAQLERYVADYNTAKLKYMDENQDIVGFESQWIDSQKQAQPTSRTTASGVTYTIVE